MQRKAAGGPGPSRDYCCGVADGCFGARFAGALWCFRCFLAFVGVFFAEDNVCDFAVVTGGCLAVFAAAAGVCPASAKELASSSMPNDVVSFRNMIYSLLLIRGAAWVPAVFCRNSRTSVLLVGQTRRPLPPESLHCCDLSVGTAAVVTLSASARRTMKPPAALCEICHFP